MALSPTARPDLHPPRCAGTAGRRWPRSPALAALALAAGVAAAPPAPPPLPDVPDPVDVRRWISQLWQPLASYGGLLNPDRLEDVVVALYRRDAIPGDLELPVGARGLAIFELRANGTYVRRALAERILPCVQCLGTFNRDPGGVPFEIDIADRRLTVSWIGNADGLLAVRLTIAWDPANQAYALIGDDLMRSDPMTGLQTRRTRDFVAGREVRDGEETAIEPRFIPIESVSAADYR